MIVLAFGVRARWERDSHAESGALEDAPEDVGRY